VNYQRLLAPGVPVFLFLFSTFSPFPAGLLRSDFYVHRLFPLTRLTLPEDAPQCFPLPPYPVFFPLFIAAVPWSCRLFFSDLNPSFPPSQLCPLVDAANKSPSFPLPYHDVGASFSKVFPISNFLPPFSLSEPPMTFLFKSPKFDAWWKKPPPSLLQPA